MSGPAWENLLAEAKNDTSSPNISDNRDNTDVYVYAKALVYLRTQKKRYRNEVIDCVMKAIGTEKRGNTLSLSRNLSGYVIAAGLVRLPGSKNKVFRKWLRGLLSKKLSGRSLQSTHYERPNNWGTFAGASRMAIAVYLNDEDELAQAARVFKGWLGDRNSYTGFKYGSNLSWQANAQNPVGINPKGAKRNGRSIDGVLPDEQRASRIVFLAATQRELRL